MKITYLLKKTAATLLISAVFLNMTGCDRGKETTASNNLEKVTIWSGDSHSKNVMQELVAEFNANEGKELGVEIEYVVKEGNLNQTVEMAIASKQEPDMYKTWSAAKLYETGEIMAIEDMEGGEEYLATYPKELTKGLKSKITHKSFTVPYYTTTFGVIYNIDMFKKHGLVDKKGNIKLPETFDEMREAAKKMTDEKNGEYGMILPVKDAVFSQIASRLSASSCGISGYDFKTGTYDYTVLEPALKFLIGLKNDNSIYPGADGMENDTARALFAEGKIGMILAG